MRQELNDWHGGISIPGKKDKKTNLRYADDTLIAASEEEMLDLLNRVEAESKIKVNQNHYS